MKIAPLPPCTPSGQGYGGANTPVNPSLYILQNSACISTAADFYYNLQLMILYLIQFTRNIEKFNYLVFR
jgi:hypothetical protein